MDIKVNLQGLFLDLGRFRQGAEIGYNRLYYYYFIVPYPPTVYYYEASVGPVSLSALGAFELFRNLFFQVSAGSVPRPCTRSRSERRWPYRSPPTWRWSSATAPPSPWGSRSDSSTWCVSGARGSGAGDAT
jgi:hypothetical protein